MNPAPQFQFEREQAALVIVPLLDMGEFNCDQIKEAATALLEQVNAAPEINLIIDFSRTKYFGSDALGLFVQLWRKMHERGGRLVFCGANRLGEEVLRRARFDHLGAICTTRDEALASVVLQAKHSCGRTA